MNDCKLTMNDSNQKLSEFSKNLSLKLAKHLRFTRWPYLIDEISSELNNNEKSNITNYNTNLIYYWEDASYLVPKWINSRTNC